MFLKAIAELTAVPNYTLPAEVAQWLLEKATWLDPTVVSVELKKRTVRLTTSPKKNSTSLSYPDATQLLETEASPDVMSDIALKILADPDVPAVEATATLSKFVSYSESHQLIAGRDAQFLTLFRAIVCDAVRRSRRLTYNNTDITALVQEELNHWFPAETEPTELALLTLWGGWTLTNSESGEEHVVPFFHMLRIPAVYYTLLSADYNWLAREASKLKPNALIDLKRFVNSTKFLESLAARDTKPNHSEPAAAAAGAVDAAVEPNRIKVSPVPSSENYEARIAHLEQKVLELAEQCAKLQRTVSSPVRCDVSASNSGNRVILRGTLAVNNQQVNIYSN